MRIGAHYRSRGQSAEHLLNVVGPNPDLFAVLLAQRDVVEDVESAEWFAVVITRCHYRLFRE